jgi:hypothetical protein
MEENFIFVVSGAVERKLEAVQLMRAANDAGTDSK